MILDLGLTASEISIILDSLLQLFATAFVFNLILRFILNR